MKYDTYLLNRLLDKYEASKGFLKEDYQRRVLYKAEKDQELSRNIADPIEKEALFKIINRLKEERLIDFKWEKFEENNLISEIWLIIEADSLAKAYALCQRVSKDKVATQNIELIQEKRLSIKTPWMLELFATILEESEAMGKNWKFMLSPNQTKDVCKVLEMLDSYQGSNIDKRILSVNLFSNSKYFELNIQNKLLQLTTRYLFDWNSALTEREKLQQMGIGFAPELLYFTGPIELVLKNDEKINCEFIPKGSYLGADMLSDIKIINCLYTKIITIENLANYYWYVQNEREHGTLVIYTGGFLTRHQSVFFKMLKTENLSELFHWGDIDLGGFRIFLQIQAIWSEIQPLKMDVATFEKYARARKKISNEYVQKVRVALEKNEFTPFREVLVKIVETKHILEQEAELYF
ncbi:Wadjet anti-phage system protein JetD domain-containing protein [Candidatus Enterococcus mansonii]|uniref:Wadjet protein JetD C-terminal domain-containing protein n=2 Tax=Candidatus Enterococcus mansonii TaxID=1834181 RepID=A0ABU8IHZ2_9ENTE